MKFWLPKITSARTFAVIVLNGDKVNDAITVQLCWNERSWHVITIQNFAHIFYFDELMANCINYDCFNTIKQWSLSLNLLRRIIRKHIAWHHQSLNCKMVSFTDWMSRYFINVLQMISFHTINVHIAVKALRLPHGRDSCFSILDYFGDI
jgi:hypothetical protein